MTGITDDLLARVGGNYTVLGEIIGLFLEDSPQQLDTIRQALGNTDATGVYRAAHALKGSVGNFDAHAAVALAQRLEARAREGDLAAARHVFDALESELHELMASLVRVRQSLPCV